MNISDVNNNGIGMDGMDAVAHFKGEPMLGSREYQATIGHVTYLFSNIENMEKFENDPAKYIPIAGGYPMGTNVAPPEITSVNGQVVGNKTFANRRGLEDIIESQDIDVPMEMKENRDLEMQNLSDSDS